MRRRAVWISGIGVIVCGTLLACAGAAWAASKLYWSNYSAGTVSVANLDGSGSVSTYASGLEGPNGLAFDPAGNLYVANDNEGTVSKVTPAGAGSTFASGMSTPYGLAIDAAGNLYVGSFSGSIYKITSSGSVSTFAPGSGLRAGLAFDAAGNLYVSNPFSGTISKITPAGTASTFASGLGRVEGLALDASGNLYAAIENGGKITKITPAGVGSTFVSGLDGPEGLVIDAAGNLYVGLRPETAIDKITPAGVVSPLLSSISEPAYLAIAEAPSGAGVPVLAGAGTVGSSLSCGAAVWAPDPPGGQLFRQPLSATIAWQLNGSVIAGASGSSFTPTQPGSYTCTSTATNQAGSSTQTSAALQVDAVLVTPIAVAVSNTISIASEKVSRTGVITLGVRTHAPGKLTGLARFVKTIQSTTGHGRGSSKHTKHKAILYGSTVATSNGTAIVDLTITPTRAAGKLLKQLKTLKLTITLSFSPTGGSVNKAVLNLKVTAPTKKKAGPRRLGRSASREGDSSPRGVWAL